MDQWLVQGHGTSLLGKLRYHLLQSSEGNEEFFSGFRGILLKVVMEGLGG